MATCISYFMCIALFLLICVQSGTSLRCYECKSAFNGECDNVKGKNIPDENCNNSKLVKAFPMAGSKFVCVIHKMAQQEGSDVNLSVVRGCAPENYCTSFSGSKQCVTCEKDLCNSSSAVLPSMVLSIASFLCAKYYF